MAEQQLCPVFVSYSHRDREFLEHLEPNLKLLERQRVIDAWYDGEIRAGDEWEPAIWENLSRADIVVVLVSQHSLASDFCNRELSRALQRHADGSVRVIPVLVRHCEWTSTELAKLQILPSSDSPLEVLDRGLSAACLEVERAIRQSAVESRARHTAQAVSEIAVQQEFQQDLLGLVSLVIPALLRDEALKHLRNLHIGNTANYEGRSSLRHELRHLAQLRLIERHEGRHIGHIRNRKTVDLADYVCLTAAGVYWLDKIKEISTIEAQDNAEVL